jgi:SAM-dependent methyltransferase
MPSQPVAETERLEEAPDLFCGADSRQQLRYEVDGMRIVQCERCGLAFVSPRLKREVQFDEVYVEGYREAPPKPGWWNAVRRAKRRALQPFRGRSRHDRQVLFVARSLRRVYGQIPAELSLLEVGSWTGNFIAEALRRFPGWKLIGVEPSEYAARVAHEERRFDVRHGWLEELDLPAESFDVVHLWHVLEHLPDPLQTIRAARACLKPGGLITLRTPNYNAAHRHWHGSRWKGWWPREHLYYFTHATLERLLRETGLERAWPRRIPFWLEWPSTLLVAARRVD